MHLFYFDAKLTVGFLQFFLILFKSWDLEERIRKKGANAGHLSTLGTWKWNGVAA